MRFGELLRELRTRADLTQAELAARAEVSERSVRRLETDPRAVPRMSTVQLLAKALDLTPDQRQEFLDAAVDPTHAPTEPVTADPLAGSVQMLAQAVYERWRHEEELRQVQDPFPLPVRWRVAAERVMDHWENICRTPAGQAAKPLKLAGTLADVVAVYRKVPSGRLVVLGQGGSGKTVLTYRFVVDWLAPSSRVEVVPVIFGLGSWNPVSTPLREWLIDRLTSDYGLTEPGVAAALVHAGRVLPVLDGFDEMSGGLRGPALERLNATAMPLVLTSRFGEYDDAVKDTDVLTAAACVHLTDLTFDDLAAYLPRTTRRTSKDAAPVWNDVLTRLPGPEGANVRKVFRTPLMVALARAVYSDTHDHDPAELLAFPTAEAVEQHLLASFVPTAYRYARWDPGRALGYLARCRDISWWEIGTNLRTSTRVLLVAVVAGLVNAVVNGLGAGLRDGLAAGLAAAAIGGVATAVGFGLVHALGLRWGGAAFEPTRVRIRGRPHPVLGKSLRRLGFGLVAGVVGGLVLGLAGGLGSEIVGGRGTGLTGGLVTGIGFGLVCGLVGAVLAWFETPIDVRSTASPADLLRVNRTAVVIQSLVWGPALGLAVGIVGGVAEGLAFGLVVGLGLGAGVGLSLTAWGQWLVLGRLWLPLTGRMPWRVMAFLEDACRRGVLRQAGAVYQFRHARLQEHLRQSPVRGGPDPVATPGVFTP